ncbi:GNAT family N-acetyltransferase [archaeon]|nr:GNAT family N-acetyltransferase [archaeon]
MKIRKLKKVDIEDVIKINYDTGFIGDSMKDIFPNRKLWYNIFFKEKLEGNLDNFFVLEINNKVEGYVLAELSNKNKKNIGLIKDLFLNYIFAKKKQKTFIKNLLLNVGKEKHNPPKNSIPIHINILKNHTNKRLGRKLLKAMEDYLLDKGVKSIYAGTFDCKKSYSRKFWLKNGFVEYSKIETKFWNDQFPDEEVLAVYYEKRIKSK